jgi:hypothetical protein
MAEQFYDTTNAVRHDLHRAFIRQCLDNFAGNSGVIQLIGAEFTGPLHFVQFWVDNVRQWEEEKGKKEMIGLSTTKDVQDAILADAARAATIDLIDIRYWYYQQDGKVYAPQGGQSLAPRQHERVLKPQRPSFEQVYHSVREYRDKYPAKAILYSAEGCDQFGWAVFIAGGSLADIPVIRDPRFLADAAVMLPVDLPGNPDRQWALGSKEKGLIIYSDKPGPVKADLSAMNGTFRVYRIHPADGTMEKEALKIKGGKIVEMAGPDKGPVVLWIGK